MTTLNTMSPHNDIQKLRQYKVSLYVCNNIFPWPSYQCSSCAHAGCVSCCSSALSHPFILFLTHVASNQEKPQFHTFPSFLCSIQVFLAECAGPLIIYLMFYFRLPFIYSPKYDFTTSKHWVVQWVSACLCFRGSVATLRGCVTQSQALRSLRWQTILKCIAMVRLSRCINCINHS